MPLEYAALPKLFPRPWFERVWALREVRMASPKSIVVCGTETLEWTYFKHALVALINTDLLSLDDGNYGNYKSGLAFGIRAHRIRFLCEYQIYSFREVMQEARTALYADPRDKIPIWIVESSTSNSPAGHRHDSRLFSVCSYVIHRLRDALHVAPNVTESLTLAGRTTPYSYPAGSRTGLQENGGLRGLYYGYRTQVEG